MSKYKKLKRVAVIKGLRFVKNQKRTLKLFVARNRHVKAMRKVAKMEAKKALFITTRFFLYQLSIRPRIRLFMAVIVALSISYMASARAVNFIKSNEDEVKINGQAVLVAGKTEENEEPEPEISQAVNSKRSPFEFQHPVEGQISQGYTSYHRASDIATALGSPIHPLGSGVVEFAGRVADGKGNVVVISHGDGLKSLYAHMGAINVGVGNQVDAKTTIGTVGLTGRTTGPHVHLEILDNDKLINPASVLTQ